MSAPETDFQRGALWALQLLKEQTRERQNRLRAAGRDEDLSQFAGAAGLLVEQIRNEFDGAVMARLLKAEVKP